MKSSPVVVQCWAGIDAARVVRSLIGVTNGRNAEAGTIRGDFSMSSQENIVHASDSAASAQIELDRFFTKNEIFQYKISTENYLYADDEL